jgi:hypothetical protein
MEFPDSVKDAAFRRSGGQCECTSSMHSHTGRCKTTLTRSSAQYKRVPVNPKASADTLANCEVLCVTCHKDSVSYGS